MGQKRSRPPKRRAGFSEDAASYAPVPKSAGPAHVMVELAAGGRLVIPAQMRAALGMKIGDRLTLRLAGNELRLHTYEEGLRQAQELVAKHLPDNAVDEFLRWRREQAALEAKKLERWSRDE